MSARDDIIKILCDTNYFPVGNKYIINDIYSIVKPLLTYGCINSVEDINHSIREAVETVDGYIYYNGSQCHLKRRINRNPIVHPYCKYEYEFL